MGVKAQDIYDLMDRFEAASATRLKLNWDGVELELEKGGAAAPVAPQIMPVAVPAMPGAAVSAPVAAPAAVPADPAPAEAAPAPAASDAGVITAPLVGVFYAAPAPDKDPYVQPGDHVKKGDTVCLLEAMKMMSEVEAPCDCTIEEVLVADGELVEFGAALIRYRED